MSEIKKELSVLAFALSGFLDQLFSLVLFYGL